LRTYDRLVTELEIILREIVRFSCNQAPDLQRGFEQESRFISVTESVPPGACAEKIAGMGPNWKSSEISSAFPCI